ncbi:hypothetical protein M9458_057254 [Cirrhinus mrigala]|uniref:Alkylated DNA repair protein AlkB homologue 8 N-terminal domain-containing protein n=1 Tax=Cirrhinus mrigala TaxID=683832 RepID=A0ABD0MCV8_CIRMR
MVYNKTQTSSSSQRECPQKRGYSLVCGHEKLVLAYLKNIIGPLLDPLQFAYRANRSVDDAVNMGLHFILQHLDRPGTYLLKFADDTTLISLIQDGEESAYRQEVKELAVWCSHNNLELNTLKTVEMIIDFRRNPPALSPLSIMDSTVATVETFKILGSVISQDLKWVTHINSIVKKAQQRLYFLLPAKKVQPTTGAAKTVLLSHHRVCSLHINYCLVWLSYKIRNQITENSSDCREDCWCSPALHPSRTVFIQSEEKSSENHSGSLTSKSSSL